MMKSWMAMGLMWLGFTWPAMGDEVGTSWRRLDEGRGDRFAGVCWDGPVAVGVGSRGLLSTSTDGKAWTLRFQGVQSSIMGVTWSGSHFVAVGSGGTILRSSNGTDWQRIAAPAGNDYSGVTWTGSQFIALDNFYYLSTSADGIAWSRSLMSVSNPGYGIEHFDGATYLRNQWGIARSTDLVTWTQVLSLSNNHLPAAIRKRNGRLFSLGQSNVIYSSSNGITWTPASLTGVTFPPMDPCDVDWNGSCYIAVGTSNRVWRSLDGLAWTTEHSAGSNASYVRWIDGEFVSGNGAGTAQASPDGREWTKANDLIQGTATAWTGSRYITVGDYGYIATSSDLETWTTRDSGIYTNLQSVVWTGSFALASGADGVVMKSDDGRLWTKVTGSTFSGSVRLAWTGTQVFAFSSSGADTSTNGTSWTRISTVYTPSFYDVKWLRGMFLGIGYSGEIRTSPDGVTWTPRSSGTTAHLFALAASDDGFLVGGQNGVLLASPDGVDWTPGTGPVVTVSSLDYHFGRWFLATAKKIYQSVDGTSWNRVPGVKGTLLLADQAEWVWTGSELACPGLAARTPDGTSWQQSALQRAAPDFNAVAKGAGGYVAVGEAGVIWHSPDGYSWEPVESPTENSLVALAARPGLWVAVGSGGVIVSSPDGVHWTPRSSGTANHLSDVASNGQRFTAVGENGTLLISPDGLTWSVETSGTGNAISNVEPAGLGFKAFAGSGIVIHSPDGIAWSISRQDWIADVTWNGTSYVGVGSGSGSSWAHVSGADGLEWTRHSMGTASFLTGICWTGTLHVACGTNGTIVTSPDGITWTQRVSGVTQWIQAVVWNGTQLVAVGHGNTLLHSPDGITWTKGTKTGASHDYEDVAWAEGRYVAAGNTGGSATSTDGMSWQGMTGSLGNSLTVDRVGTRFLAGGYGLFSTTSTQWVSATNSGFAATLYDLESNGAQLFAATSGGVYSLTENTPGKWNTSSLVHASPWLDNMTRKGSEFVATGANGTVVLSRDGTTWQNVKGGRDAAFRSTATNGSRFVGVGSSRPMVSPDGGTWNASAAPSNSTLAEVIWTGSRFLGVGPGRVLRSSPDGTTWANIGSTALSPSGASSVAGNDELLVAVGADGLIVVSDGSGDGSGDYHAWMSAQGAGTATGAPLQDANADGVSNLIAYIHGIPATGSLTSAQRAALPSVSFDPADGSPVLTFELRESYRPGAIYEVEVSPDLQADSWQSVQRYSAGWASGLDQASITESPLPGGGVRITVSNFQEIESPAGCFFRLRAFLP